MRAIFLEVRELERIKTAKVTSEVNRSLLLVPSIKATGNSRESMDPEIPRGNSREFKTFKNAICSEF